MSGFMLKTSFGVHALLKKICIVVFREGNVKFNLEVCRNFARKEYFFVLKLELE